MHQFTDMGLIWYSLMFVIIGGIIGASFVFVKLEKTIQKLKEQKRSKEKTIRAMTWKAISKI